MEGFLIFILFWIGSYWFSTFFTQLIHVKSKEGKNKWLVSKRGRRLMGDATAVISAALICFWIYFYVSRYTSLLSFMNK
jgi:Mn2+/Fe2+ NRAMP family transporter